jgi:rhodanese-related sulfurtransferase
MDILSISAHDAYDLLHAGKSIALDVRTHSEYIAGHIPQAHHIPLDQLKKELLNENIDSERDIVVYCASGNRSRIACDILLRHGHERCFNLLGGIGVWRMHNFPIVH